MDRTKVSAPAADQGAHPYARPVDPSSQSNQSVNAAKWQLNEEKERAFESLKQRDADVRAHEHAQATAGGDLAGAPAYEFAAGPDDKRYAVGGEVQIDSTRVHGNPEATIRKMEIVISAALAPSDPSSQEMAVARQAQRTRAQARSKLAKADGPQAQDGSGSTRIASAESRLLQAQTAYDRANAVQNDTATAELIFDTAAQRTTFA